MRSKVFFAFVLSVITSCLSLHAQTVSPEAARAKAMDFFSTGAKNLPARKGAIRKAPAVSNVELAYTSEKGGKTCFYVYNNGTDGGFVIVGGDEVAQEILAYVPQGHFDYDKAPDNLKWWLGQYEQEIDSAIVMTRQMPASAIRKSSQRSSSFSYQDVPDMITTKWNQGVPFNSAIPKWVHGDETTEFPTGCTATAIAQIMNYWQCPTQGRESNSYVGIYYGDSITFSADFGNTTYDWANMRDCYDGDYSETEANAVAELMYHAGVAISTRYTPEGSAWVSMSDEESYNLLPKALSKYFGYSSRARFLTHDAFTDEEWENAVYYELTDGRPLLYTGNYPYSGTGHAFVVHGYSSALQMFSINWGWGGLDDGYYSLSSTSALNGYSDSQMALFGFQPENHTNTNPYMGEVISVDGYYYYINDPINKHVTLCRNDEFFINETQSNYDEMPYRDTVVIPEQIVYNEETYTVTSIGTRAFLCRYAGVFGGSLQSNYHLQAIILPSTISSLSPRAFEGCHRITKIALTPLITSIPEQCFTYCEELVEITNIDNVQSFGDFCFSNCGFTDFTIPEGVSYLPAGTFIGCKNLRSLTMPQSLEYIHEVWTFDGTSLCKAVCHAQTPPDCPSPIFGSIANHGVLYVPQSSIEAYQEHPVWKVWGHIEAIETMSPSDIGSQFTHDGLKYLVLADGVSIVGYTSLPIVFNVPDSVQFNDHTYPVFGIEPYAFEYCTVKYLYLPNTLNYIGNNAFSSSYITYVSIPNSVTSIGEDAFQFSRGLRSIDVPGSIKNVRGFGGCKYLTTVKLRNGIESIGANAFFACPDLKDICIPNTVSMINYQAFQKCSNLSNVIVSSPKIDYDDFMGLGSPAFDGIPASSTLYATDSLYQDLNSYIHQYPWDAFGQIQTLIPAETIQMKQHQCRMSLNEEVLLNATVGPSEASNKRVIWRTENPEIAVVGYDGLVIARKAGTVKIYAESLFQDGLIDSCEIVVTPSAVKRPDIEGCLFADDFSNGTFDESKWQDQPVLISGSQRIVSKPIAFAGGTLKVMINATVDDEECLVILGSDTLRVETLSNPDRETRVLTFEQVPANPTLSIVGNCGLISYICVWDPTVVREKYKLTYNMDGDVFSETEVERGSIITPLIAPTRENYTFYRWDGLPEDMVMPDYDLEVTAIYILRGDANHDEKVDHQDVEAIKNHILGVRPLPLEYGDINESGEISIVDIAKIIEICTAPTNVASITLSETSLVLGLDETRTLTASISPADADNSEVIWESSNPDVVYVDNTGKVVAMEYGQATITCSATDGSGVVGTCIITVSKPHEYVDLGLSVKWATCNVGAENPEDYGLYFAWGEATGYGQDTNDKRQFNWESYKWCKGSNTTMTKYCTLSKFGTEDNKNNLESEDDAAHVNWGGSWRMPTKAEQDELRDNCIWEWVTMNNVEGYKITSKTNGNSIFLPAAGYRNYGSLYSVGSGGYYWPSTLNSTRSDYAHVLFFNSGYVGWGSSDRCSGYSIRPVCP